MANINHKKPIKYRLYIDESWRSHYIQKEGIPYRYLALTGVIISDQESIEKLNPAMYELKKMFISDPDDIPNLHAESIARKEHSFSRLQNLDNWETFRKNILWMIQNIDFQMTTVVIDKTAHLEKYGDASENPYSYCLKIILERYVKFLESKKARGDVMVESRGHNEDHALQEEYEEFYLQWTYFVSTERIKNVITSKNIKFEKKYKNIAWLELVDQLVLPSKFDIFQCNKVVQEVENSYIKDIISVIQSKYLCKDKLDGQNSCSRIDGYWKKFLS